MLLRKFQVSALQDLEGVAEYVNSLFSSYLIFCFNGQMGAGKTTLIKSLMAKLNAEDQVSSPTYSIVNEYHIENGKKVFHFDFYRLKDIDEALSIGCEEYFESGSICLIEWPELIEPLLFNKYVSILITEDNGLRIIEISEKGG